jgi:hypothetical protein
MQSCLCLLLPVPGYDLRLSERNRVDMVVQAPGRVHLRLLRLTDASPGAGLLPLASNRENDNGRLQGL